MDIQIESAQSLIPLNYKTVSPVVESVLSLEDERCDEVIIHFIEESKMCEIHDHFFNDPSPTDCISIQVDGSDQTPRFLGEIFISPQAAIDYCKEDKGDLYEELTLYLVHGLLHLLGYTDKEEGEIAKMRLAEKRQMDYLKEHNLLLKK